MKKEILKEWFNQISNYEKLKINEAQELYKKAINTTDNSLKKIYMEKLILGTLYVVYNYVVRNNLEILCSSLYDINDIISAFNEVWIKKIYNGELLNVDKFSLLFTSSYFNDVYNNLLGDVIIPHEQFGITAELFTELFYEYVNHKNKGLTFDFLELLKQYYQDDINERSYIIQLFEKIYYNLNLENLLDSEIGKTKIKDYFKLFISSGIFDNLTDTIPDSYDMETSIINKILFKSFIKDLDESLSTERERDIIHQRYGLDDREPKTFEEIAKQYNITRERVRQIEARALRMLKHPQRKLKKYY